MASATDLIVRVITDSSKAAKDIDATAGKFSKFQSGVQKAALPAAAALLGIGAAAVKAGNAAAEDAQSQATLANTIENTTGAHAAGVAAIEDYISKLSLATGVADDELRPAMGNLLRATGDAAESQKALTAALDISAATGKDVNTVSEALAKAYGGQAGSLKRLVPSLSDAAVKSGDMSRIMGELAHQTGGAAAVAADTTAGKMKIMTVQMDEAQEAIGSALLPAMTKLADMLTTVAMFAGEHPQLFTAIAAAVAAAAASILVLNVAMKALTLATSLFGKEAVKAWLMALGPIGLIIIAVGLLTAAVVILWKRSETFRNIVLAVWSAIKAAATSTGRAIEAAWQAVLNAGRAAFQAVKQVWNNVTDTIANVARELGSAIEAVWNTLKGAVTSILNGIQSTASAVWTAIRNAASSAWSAVAGAIQSAVNRAASVLGQLPGKVKSAFSGAASWLVSAGADVIRGLLNGMESMAGAVYAKAREIADKITSTIKGAFGSHSPSKVMKAIGRDVMLGLGIGIEETAPEVEATMSTVADRITNTLSKAFEKAAKAGLPKKASDKRTAKVLAAATEAAATAGQKVLKSLRDEHDALTANSLARAANAEELKNQQQILDSMVQQQQQYAQSVKESAQAYGALTNATVEEGEAFTAAGMLAQMRARVTAVQNFQNTLNQLRAAGLSEQTLADLQAAGVETGGAMAAALAAGGPAAVAEVNAMQTQLDAASTALGTSAAAGMYGAGVQAQQALVDGLVANQAALEIAAETLATSLAKAIKKALKKALKGVGGSGGGGGGGGSTLMAPTGANLAPVVPITSARSAGGSTSVVNVNVTGAIDPEATARQIRRILAGHDRRVGLTS